MTRHNVTTLSLGVSPRRFKSCCQRFFFHPNIFCVLQDFARRKFHLEFRVLVQRANIFVHKPPQYWKCHGFADPIYNFGLARGLRGQYVYSKSTTTLATDLPNLWVVSFFIPFRKDVGDFERWQKTTRCTAVL